MLNVCPIAQTVGPTSTLLDGSPLPSSEAGWIEYAKKYASGGVVAPSKAPSTAPSTSGVIFARRTNTAGFNQYIATCEGTTIKILDDKWVMGRKIDIPVGWTLESAAFNENVADNGARYNCLLVTFKKIDGTETNKPGCWLWNAQDPSLHTQWFPPAPEDLASTPGAPWPKPPK
jgi:hypothetical protein